MQRFCLAVRAHVAWFDHLHGDWQGVAEADFWICGSDCDFTVWVTSLRGFSDVSRFDSGDVSNVWAMSEDTGVGTSKSGVGVEVQGNRSDEVFEILRDGMMLDPGLKSLQLSSISRRTAWTSSTSILLHSCMIGLIKTPYKRTIYLQIEGAHAYDIHHLGFI